MSRAIDIVNAAPTSAEVLFRAKPYTNAGTQEFLRDVLAMANCPVDGPRYIVIGVDHDKHGHKHLHSIACDDFSAKPSYRALVSEHVEPPVRVKYQALTIEDKHIGIFEISESYDRPYMMRIDFSESLRRGDAWIRIDNKCIKMGRRQLRELFEQKFCDSVAPNHIEIGFPGDIIHKQLRIETTDLEELPSVAAHKKLQQLLAFKENTKKTGWSTVLERLTIARLFGTQNPYEGESTGELRTEVVMTEEKHQQADETFLFEENASRLQLVVLNQGTETIQGASLTLVMPNHSAFYMAERLPLIEESPVRLADYPDVSINDDAIHVGHAIGDLPPDSPVEVFGIPLRICVGDALKGRRLAIHYSLFGHNLREPAKGTLHLAF